MGGDWLGPGWVESAASLWPSLPEAPGADGSVSLSFVTGPRKEVAIHWSYADGRPVGGGAGADPDAGLVLSVAAADAADVVSGRVEPSVAFMRGRLKATGDGALLLAFLRSTAAAGFEDWRRGLAGLAPVPG
ncbi:MAG TPA: SCP2 sterol-binding domain-containing protein [Acidimicrobiales bacterium]|nr:SCP2 sterol-binding domain-containing protein [Acidimicrobiales bacterium]